MRLLSSLALALLLLPFSSARAKLENEVVRVLFVGNSLTYVGNLPAVFDALSQANGRHSSSDMIVAGGATLTDRVKDGAVTLALSANKYSFVVLQERGGDFTCGFGPDACKNARYALAALADVVRQHGATPLLLGTYQELAAASAEIVAAESKAAQAIGIDYVSVSERLRDARTALPHLQWFAADGMHPGHDLTLLDALLLYERIHGARPAGSGFTIEAPVFAPKSGLKPELRSASAAAPQGGAARVATYDSDEVTRLVKQLW
jgi:hypothetical protein